MTPDDRRHATEAGYEQHLRDGEEPCEPCATADLRASRRRQKRKTMGHIYVRPVGQELWDRLQEFRRRGCSLNDIATAAEIADSRVWDVLAGGPDTEVYARTWNALNGVGDLRVLTSVGMTRRVRAMVAMGYSYPVIATASGVDRDTVHDAAVSVRPLAHKRVLEGIADAYDRLAMTPRTGDRYVRCSASRARSIADANGWHSALAWDDETIDDPRSTPMTSGTDDHIDHVVVQRLLDGKRIDSTPAEKAEAIRRWMANGGSRRAICQMHGWHESRYKQEAS